jgi:cobalt-zinc-cadmium efflux system protein
VSGGHGSHGGHGGHGDHGSHGGHGGLVAPPSDIGFRFKLAILLNLVIVAGQGVFGWWSGSMALIADAGHNLSDVLGLVVAYAAVLLSRRPPDARFTYGLGGSSILAALFNAIFLLVAVGALSWEAIGRLREPPPVAGGVVMIVAAIALVLNGFTAWLFMHGSKSDLNMRGAFLHMAADAGVSAGVVLSGLVILLTGWLWLDPLASLVINAVVVWGTWSLLRQSLSMSLSGVPGGIDLAAVESYLRERPGVQALHDLHVWPLSTTQTALTVHLVTPAGHPGDAFLLDVTRVLEHRFGIGHVTLQIETDPALPCHLAGGHRVSA